MRNPPPPKGVVAPFTQFLWPLPTVLWPFSDGVHKTLFHLDPVISGHSPCDHHPTIPISGRAETPVSSSLVTQRGHTVKHQQWFRAKTSETPGDALRRHETSLVLAHSPYQPQRGGTFDHFAANPPPPPPHTGARQSALWGLGCIIGTNFRNPPPGLYEKKQEGVGWVPRPLPPPLGAFLERGREWEGGESSSKVVTAGGLSFEIC